MVDSRVVPVEDRVRVDGDHGRVFGSSGLRVFESSGRVARCEWRVARAWPPVRRPAELATRNAQRTPRRLGDSTTRRLVRLCASLETHSTNRGDCGAHDLLSLAFPPERESERSGGDSPQDVVAVGVAWVWRELRGADPPDDPLAREGR